MDTTRLAGRLLIAAALAGGTAPAVLHAANDAPRPQQRAVPPYGLRVAPVDAAELPAMRVPFALEVTYSIALAYNCGLRLGDRIVAVNGQAFDSEDAFWNQLERRSPSIRLDVRRGGDAMELPLDASAPGCSG